MVKIIELDNKKVKVIDETLNPGGCMRAEYGKIDDPDTTYLIKKYTERFSKDDIFLDIGSNTGLMSLFSSNVKVIAFEPYEPIYKILYQNVILNKEKRILPLNMAIHNKEEKYSIEKHPTNHGENKIKIDKNSNRTTKTIDFFKLKRVVLMKIDTEGNDTNVLKGAVETIKKNKPMLIIENPDKKYLSNVLNYMQIGNIGINSIWIYDYKKDGEK